MHLVFVLKPTRKELEARRVNVDGSVNLHAHTMTAVAVSPDRTDVFKMWVEGTLLNDGGVLTGGNVQIHKN